MIWRPSGSPALSSPPGTLIAGRPASEDGTVRLWDLKTNASKGTIQPQIGAVAGVAFSGPGKRVAMAGRTSAMTAVFTPGYAAPDGSRKIPAAWLVEYSGFSKGYTKGRAGISRKHALAIVNRGDAHAAEIIALKDEIQAGVRNRFGIQLQPEPVLVGFDDH